MPCPHGPSNGPGGMTCAACAETIYRPLGVRLPPTEAMPSTLIRYRSLEADLRAMGWGLWLGSFLAVAQLLGQFENSLVWVVVGGVTVAVAVWQYHIGSGLLQLEESSRVQALVMCELTLVLNLLGLFFRRQPLPEVCTMLWILFVMARLSQGEVVCVPTYWKQVLDQGGPAPVYASIPFFILPALFVACLGLLVLGSMGGLL
jgi:hypothetical protein